MSMSKKSESKRSATTGFTFSKRTAASEAAALQLVEHGQEQ